MLKEVLDNLTDEQRKQLMYAFENDLSQHVDLPGGRYIGVNTSHVRHLHASESAGKWSYGVNKAEQGE